MEKPSFIFADQVRLHTVVSETVDGLKDGFAAKNITVENRIPDSLPPMSVEKPKFYRLFELLLKDEIASLPAGSRVELSAKLLGEMPPEKQLIQLQIHDNGPGLPKEALRLVFDPFVVRGDTPM